MQIANVTFHDRLGWVSLAEAGKSDSYSIGMTLYDKELFNTEKWTKNVLGQLLMKVRDELV